MLQRTLNPYNEIDSIIFPFGVRLLPDYLSVFAQQRCTLMLNPQSSGPCLVFDIGPVDEAAFKLFFLEPTIFFKKN